MTRTVLALEPQAAAERARTARQDRRVSIEPGQDAVGWLNALLPTEDLAAIWQRLDGLSRAGAQDDERTLDQRRAEVLRDLLLTGTAASIPAVVPYVYVTASVETLLGLADLPGEVRGVGPLPAAQVRALAYQLSSVGSGVLVDERGQPQRMATRRYRFSGRLAEFIRLRDQTCVHPACGRSAQACDIDHRVPYPRGTTSAGNGDPLCRRHHRMKHATAWTTHRRADGTVVWQHPTGATHTNEPVPLASGSPLTAHERLPSTSGHDPPATVPHGDGPPPF